jgi:hypothetical protein
MPVSVLSLHVQRCAARRVMDRRGNREPMGYSMRRR